MGNWSRNDVIAITSLLVAVIACFATVMVPEVRSFMGLPPEHQPAKTTAPGPVHADTQTEEPAAPALETCVPGEEHTENGIVFVHICPGTFTMGSADDDPQAFDDEKPAHKVTLSEFWIGKTEITNKQYRLFRQAHQGEGELPAIDVSWTEAKAACARFGGRLPTEAEWEYAARADSRLAWSFGDDEELLGEYAWYFENSGRTLHPVGEKKPNAWGLHDMHGNATEWVADWDGAYSPEVRVNPTGPPDGEVKVMRGGSVEPARYLRSANRNGFRPEDRSRVIGFRCVWVPRRQP